MRTFFALAFIAILPVIAHAKKCDLSVMDRMQTRINEMHARGELLDSELKAYNKIVQTEGELLVISCLSDRRFEGIPSELLEKVQQDMQEAHEDKVCSLQYKIQGLLQQEPNRPLNKLRRRLKRDLARSLKTQKDFSKKVQKAKTLSRS